MPPNPRGRHPPFAARDGQSMAATKEAMSGTKGSAVRRDPISRLAVSAARKDSSLAVSVKVVAIKAMVTACADVGRRSRDEGLLVIAAIAMGLKVAQAWDGQDAAQKDLAHNGRDVRTSVGAAVLKAAPALAHPMALAANAVLVARKVTVTWHSSTATNGKASRDKVVPALVVHHRARAATVVSVARKALATWHSSTAANGAVRRNKVAPALAHHRARVVNAVSVARKVRVTWRSNIARNGAASRVRAVLALVAHPMARAASVVSVRKALVAWHSSIARNGAASRVRAVLALARHKALAANAVLARKVQVTWRSTIDNLDRVRAVPVDSASSVTWVRSNTRSAVARASTTRKVVPA